MSATLLNTQVDVFTALVGFLKGVYPQAAVVRALDNNVPMPRENVIVLTPLSAKRLSTNVTTYDADTGLVTLRMPSEYTIQVDCYGDTANDTATMLAVLWRDGVAVAQFPDGITPLYAADARQMPFQNDERQYEERWMVEITLQYNAQVTLPYESAISLDVPVFKAVR